MMMIGELNHRVKNTLSTVQSIVWRCKTLPIPRSSGIESRLYALSRSHDLLTRENWEGAGLLDLLKEVMEPFGVAGRRAERIVITAGIGAAEGPILLPTATSRTARSVAASVPR